MNDCTSFVQYFQGLFQKPWLEFSLMLMPFYIYFTVVEARILFCLQAVQVLRPLLVAVPPWWETVMEPFTVSRKTSKISYLYKQRKLPFKIMYVFCLSCPSATFALQHGGFVPLEWLAAKGPIEPKQGRNSHSWLWPPGVCKVLVRPC